MTTWQAFIMGLVQGLTEFLPISSSGHLVLAPWFFGWKDPGLAFDVFLHMGTLVAVGLYFFRDWLAILRAGIASIIERKIGFDRDRSLFWLIVFANVPAGVAGLLFNDAVETSFRAPLLIAITLASVGFLLYWVDGRSSTLRNLDEIGMKEAIWIGLAQACAIIPGVSRSGATITMARALGFNRETAARFSFLLSLPIIFAAALFKWKDLAEATGTVYASRDLIVGFLTSAISGILSIHMLLRFVRHANYAIFGWYRIGVALLIIFWSLAHGN